ncbi:MAG: segregation/condensation protein A [Clostridia bacterium]|nr:segregation/condensation protein A [Clostridia bacterium]
MTENEKELPAELSQEDVKDDFNQENFQSDVDYNTVLDVFEGPLDLLLHLINTAKINIEDVFVSQVTEQFLDYIEFMKTQPSRDVDKESLYLQLAAQLIYIKSKSMLPVVEMPDEEYYDDVELEKQDLIEQLKQREMELIRDETKKLKEMETVGYCYRDTDEEFSKVKVVYKDFTVDGLLEAFARLMLKNESLSKENDGVKEIPMDNFTVEDKIGFIKDTLVERGETAFEKLFNVYSKSEIITTFQAMLEMLKHQYIMVVQTEIFGEINIKLNPEWDLKVDALEQFDEYN